MRNSRAATISTIFFFVFFILIGTNPGLFPETEKDEAAISKLLNDAEDNYQNGKFKEAINLYEQIILKLNQRKELVKTKQKLFRTMISLALTYFTIQETAKSKIQLEKLIKINPNQEIDKEIFPPKFIKMFRDVQTNFIGELNIVSTPQGASVMIDNTSIGTTPLKITKFLKGEYVITVAKKGYKITTKKININQGISNMFEVTLEKTGEKKVIEKKGIKKEKKKRISPILLVGGAIAIGAILLLALKKDSEPAEVVVSKQFNNDTPVPIAAFIPVYSLLEASGITGTIKKIEFSVTVIHPRIEDLNIALIGTDNRTIYSVWNKGPHEDSGKTFIGSTEVFNSVAANGSWKITVSNSGERRTGEIRKWMLKIYYVR
ncbi:MAG: PEGA domain-containing protein [Candidatus Aminicenantes bacterium]|nr:PEGA domain-containing protein [Candidatus Aminicenantes bacterium]MCK5004564.1 PEGA domain-containing protein [Candidatus Aminicenantes bacterium]